MNKTSKFFKNKIVIVTGHTGFKGTWLALWLKLLGARVIGVSKDIPTKPSMFLKIKLKSRITHIKSDLRNLNKLKKIFIKYKPDFVFHLAAQSLVKKSYLAPIDTFQSNIIGTANVLEALRFVKKKCVSIIITSDKSYKNLEIKRGYKENDLLGGKDPYSASKASAELIIQSYINSFFNTKFNNKKIAIARAGNVIGGGDWAKDRLIPDCVRAWSKKKIAIVRNPNSTRPWQHVFEALRGYIDLAIKLSINPNLHGEAFNFGPSKLQNKTVLQLILQAKKSWKNIKWKVSKEKNSKFESRLLKLNSNKAKRKIRWEPKLKFKDSINIVIEWYKTFYEKKENLFDFSKKQLENYNRRIS